LQSAFFDKNTIQKEAEGKVRRKAFEGASFLSTHDRTTPEIFGFRVFSFGFGNFLNEYGFADFC